MVRLMLNAHPQINCPGERDFMVGYLNHRQSELALDRAALADDRIFKSSGLAIPDTSDGAEAFWDMVRQSTKDRPDQCLVLVLHRHLKELLEIFPEVPIVHLVRDPRDVARSSIGMGWAGNTYYGVDHWLKTEQGWDDEAGRLPDGQVCLTRFEDILANPERELGRVCSFAGLSYDPKMLDFDETSTYSKVDPSLAYQWKHKQTAQELGELEHKIGDLLRARGYEPSGNSIAQPSKWRAITLALKNRQYVITERIRRFGLVDTLLLTLSRRLKLRKLQRDVQLRKDEKLRAFLK